MNLRRHILIFHQAALGDFIMTWPLAMALGRVFAQSRVMYVTGPDKGRLAEEVINVEWLAADSGWHALHIDGGAIDDRVNRILQSTQCAVVFAQNDEPIVLGNLRRFAGADIPLIHIRPNPPAGVHVMKHQLAQLEGHGKLSDYVEQMQSLLLTTGLPTAGMRTGVMIHPGSGSRDKNWPLESFQRVADLLRAGGHAVQLLLGEVERERMEAPVLAQLRTQYDVIEPTDLSSLRSALSKCAAYLGNDSGPTHLAAALGLPTIALFGPRSDALQWHPVGPRVLILPFSTTPDDIARQLV